MLVFTAFVSPGVADIPSHEEEILVWSVEDADDDAASSGGADGNFAQFACGMMGGGATGDASDSPCEALRYEIGNTDTHMFFRWTMATLEFDEGNPIDFTLFFYNGFRGNHPGEDYNRNFEFELGVNADDAWVEVSQGQIGPDEFEDWSADTILELDRGAGTLTIALPLELIETRVDPERGTLVGESFNVTREPVVEVVNEECEDGGMLPECTSFMKRFKADGIGGATSEENRVYLIHPYGDLLPPGVNPGKATQLSLGDEHSCAMREGGNVECWGNNHLGQAENYTIGNALGVSAGGQHTCAVLQNGNIHCWGDNSHGQSSDYVGGDAVNVSAGGTTTCALLSNGNAHCWGNDGHGQSDGYFGGDAVGVRSGGTHACVLVEGDNVRCWGNNEGGQAENYTEGNAVDFSLGGNHTCVALSHGGVHCWGDNGDGQSEPFANGVAVGTGAAHTCGLLASGDVDCWGDNDNGQSENYSEADATIIAGGGAHTCVLREDLGVTCWGENSHGQSEGLPPG